MTVRLVRPVVAAAKEGRVVLVMLPAGATVKFEYVLDDILDVVCDGGAYLAMCQDLLDATRHAVSVES